MRTLLFVALAAVMLMALVPTASAFTPYPPPSSASAEEGAPLLRTNNRSAVLPAHYIVQTHNATETAAVIAALPDMLSNLTKRNALDNTAPFPVGLSVTHELRFQYDAALHGFAVRFILPSLSLFPSWTSALVLEQVEQRLQHMPGVALVEEDAMVESLELQSQTADSTLWNLDRVDQRPNKGDGLYYYNTTASTVHAYVLDTGIHKSHAEFEGRADWSYNAFDAMATPVNAEDLHGHGTHVAGTVGGKTFGLAKKVNLHAVRVLDEKGSGSDSTVVAGLNWVAKNRIRPAVAVLSLGGDISSSLDTAVKNTVAAGVVVVVAAGNSNADACGSSPAHVDVAITVAASDQADARASFSNYGSCVTLFAPGVSIVSASYKDDTSSATMQGTSMAAPHVAGAVALYLSRKPDASAAQVKSDLICFSTKDAISNPAASPNRALFSFVTEGSPVDDGSNTAPADAIPTGNNQNEQCTTASPCSGPYTATLRSSGERVSYVYNTSAAGGIHRAWLNYNLGGTGGLFSPVANNALTLMRWSDAMSAWETMAVANDAANAKSIQYDDGTDTNSPAGGASWSWVVEARGATPSKITLSYKLPTSPSASPSAPPPSTSDECSATNRFDPNPNNPNNPGQDPDGGPGTTDFDDGAAARTCMHVHALMVAGLAAICAAMLW